MTTQWEKRVKVIQILYSYFVDDISNEDFLKKCTIDYNCDIFQLKIIEVFLANKNKIINLVNKTSLNNTWNFLQLNNVVKAILGQSIAEFIAFRTSKAIIIDQAVITAKNFCDKDAANYINAILDKVL